MTAWKQDVYLGKDVTAVVGCAVVGIAIVGVNHPCGGCNVPSFSGGCDVAPVLVGECDPPPAGDVT